MSPPDPGSASRTVLVADDSRAMRMVIGRTLVGGGYEVRMAEDGHMLRSALQAPDAPRLIVSDWQMPGATGLEVCRELRARPGGDAFFFVVVTANVEQEHLLEGLAAGANDFIRKPFNPAELLARVDAGRRILELQSSLEDKVRELEAALAEVHTLRGLIPICMHCHRIRTDEDNWQKLEAYLESHSGVQLSHALCAECLEKYYPEEDDDAA